MIRFQTVIASFNVTTGASFNLQNNTILLHCFSHCVVSFQYDFHTNDPYNLHSCSNSCGCNCCTFLPMSSRNLRGHLCFFRCLTAIANLAICNPVSVRFGFSKRSLLLFISRFSSLSIKNRYFLSLWNRSVMFFPFCSVNKFKSFPLCTRIFDFS